MMLPLAMMGMALRDWIRYDVMPWRDDSKSFRKDPESWMDDFGLIVSRTGALGPMQLLLDADRSSSWGRSFFFALMGPAATKVEELATTGDVLRVAPVFSMLPEERRAFREALGGMFD
jgi:hypothetical protein